MNTDKKKADQPKGGPADLKGTGRICVHQRSSVVPSGLVRRKIFAPCEEAQR
jgi:hypothetical protein